MERIPAKYGLFFEKYVLFCIYVKKISGKSCNRLKKRNGGLSLEDVH